jgi:hypothetical protein
MGMTNIDWKKECSVCGGEQKYSSQEALLNAIKKATLCGSCARSGKNNAQYGKIGTNTGKKFSQEHREKISQSVRGEKHWGYGKHQSSIRNKKHSCSMREFYSSNPLAKISKQTNQICRYNNPDERKKTSDAVKMAMYRPEVRKRFVDAMARTKWLKVKADGGQLELLEKWNRLGFKFEPNYQVHTDTDLFYIDGYDEKHNVVIEYDSKYHHRPHQQQKDLIRQQKIIDILQPKKFWRYDAINKQWKNVRLCYPA